MKNIAIVPLLLFASNLFGQTPVSNLFEVSTNFKKIYVDKRDNYIIAFDMGKYLDKGGAGSSIEEMDTLLLQPGNNYTGRLFTIQVRNEQMYISSLTDKKPKEYKLKKVENSGDAFYSLNNAYFLDSYFSMSDKLNKRYELNHHSFRNGFSVWESLANKEIDYSAFRSFSDKIIQQISDSISDRQEYLTRLTYYLINNVNELSYSGLKDSIVKIPAEYPYQSSYYKTVVDRISKQRPEYVVSLYREFPENRTLIEFAVEKDKPLLQKLKGLYKEEVKLAKKK